MDGAMTVYLITVRGDKAARIAVYDAGWPCYWCIGSEIAVRPDLVTVLSTHEVTPPAGVEITC